MVLLILTAMATTSKVLFPYIENTTGKDRASKAIEISRYLLLTAGYPVDWGQDIQTIPNSLGFAETEAVAPYDLDIDKVSRLNSENRYSLSYAQMFSALGMPDVSFRIQVKLCFDVTIELTRTYPLPGEIVYQFGVLTDRNGLMVASELVWYVVAAEYLGSGTALALEGQASFNVTVQDTVDGPGLLAVLARSCYDDKMVSFGVYSFTHGSVSPQPNGTFLRLSPLNDTLDAYFLAENLNMSDVYSLTFSRRLTLMSSGGSNQSVMYDIPRLIDSSPIVLVATGWNGSRFFAEWTSYPQVPVVAGADFAGRGGMAEVSVYQYVVAIRDAVYECTVWVGGLRE